MKVLVPFNWENPLFFLVQEPEKFMTAAMAIVRTAPFTELSIAFAACPGTNPVLFTASIYGTLFVDGPHVAHDLIVKFNEAWKQLDTGDEHGRKEAKDKIERLTGDKFTDV